jgi:hypothetical protein
MRRRTRALAAIVILLCAGTDRFSAVPVSDAPASRNQTEVISLISIRYRAEVQETIEAPVLTSPGLRPDVFSLSGLNFGHPIHHELPWLPHLSGAERCYLLMSLGC